MLRFPQILRNGPNPSIVCPNCHKGFTPKNNTQKYCSSKCSNQFNDHIIPRQRKVGNRPNKETLQRFENGLGIDV